MTHDPACPQVEPCPSNRWDQSPIHWSDSTIETETPICNNCRAVCCCYVIDYVREWERAMCPSNLEAYLKGMQDGYKKAEKYYTNSCFYCGYAGEWSTYVCDECIERLKKEDEDGV